MSTQTYIVPEQNIDALTAALDKLARKAAKLNCSLKWFARPASVQIQVHLIGGEVSADWRWQDSAQPVADGWEKTGRARQMFAVWIEGEAPTFGGWSLVGILAPVAVDGGEAENVVRTVPGEAVPEEYRKRVGDCDHCCTVRRRSETFVVRHESGAHKMVGRNCLKDFLGHKSPHELAAAAELLCTIGLLCSEAELEERDEQRGATSWELEMFLAATFAQIRLDGWTSRTKAKDFGGCATADNVISFFVRKGMSSSWLKERIPTEADDAQAAAAIAWCRELNCDSDYLHNINLISRAGYVTWKNAGYAASIAVAYDNALRRMREERTESAHVGKVKERLELELTVRNVKPIDGFYGETGLHVMTDAAGNDFTWFASGSTEWLEVGQAYRVKATVKAHDEYKGRKKTTLTRVSVVKELAAAS